MTRAILVTYTIILAYSFIEETTNHSIKRILFWPFQATSWSQYGPSIDWEHVTRIRAYRTNWNMTTLSLLIWPVLWVAAHHLEQRHYKVYAIVSMCMLTAAVLQSEHETAMIALVLSAATFAALQLFSVKTIALSTAISCLMLMLFIVPISQTLFDKGAHLNTSLPGSFRHRIVLWKYTADRVAEQPLRGVGIGSTSPLDAARGSNLPYVDGTKYQLRTGYHTHNIYLQIIYEYGVLGSILFLAWISTILFRITQLPAKAAKFFLATLTIAAVTSISSFGLYELWYLSAIAFSAAMLAAVNRLETL